MNPLRKNVSFQRVMPVEVLLREEEQNIRGRSIPGAIGITIRDGVAYAVFPDQITADLFTESND